MSAAILWFRRNLRLCDNRAVQAAAASGLPVIPLYVLDDDQLGDGSRWWLQRSLVSLDDDLKALGSRLILRRGEPAKVIKELILETGANSIFYSQRREPLAREEQKAVDALTAGSFEVQSFDDEYMNPPEAVRTGAGQTYRVFTPYWRASLEFGEPDQPDPAPSALTPWSGSLDSVSLAELDLRPRDPDRAAGMRASWTPGEAGALQRLEDATKIVARYAEDRDRPDLGGTSRLSPHLHFGEISPRQVWHSLRPHPGSAALLRQLYWREFSAYLLYHSPRLPDTPLREEFEFFPWVESEDALQAWQQGNTGYPLVDAGMRQLWSTGWMHNRVRMVAASFLVKDLLIPWQQGAEWFEEMLVDADLANNSASWQWVAGCGTDAAPYFRIFNPTTQQSKFDPDGTYVRRWIPELSTGEYPAPIVDHGEARRVALAAYQTTRDLLKSRAG